MLFNQSIIYYLITFVLEKYFLKYIEYINIYTYSVTTYHVYFK